MLRVGVALAQQHFRGSNLSRVIYQADKDFIETIEPRFASFVALESVKHKSEPTSLTCASQDGSKQLLSSNLCSVLVDRSHCNVGFNFFANETSCMEDDQLFLMQDVYDDDYGSDHIDGDGY